MGKIERRHEKRGESCQHGALLENMTSLKLLIFETACCPEYYFSFHPFAGDCISAKSIWPKIQPHAGNLSPLHGNSFISKHLNQSKYLFQHLYEINSLYSRLSDNFEWRPLDISADADVNSESMQILSHSIYMHVVWHPSGYCLYDPLNHVNTWICSCKCDTH